MTSQQSLKTLALKKTKTGRAIAELNDELQEQLSSDFWIKSSIERYPPSTFGSGLKVQRRRKDDGYELTRSSTDWLNIDSDNVTHGRLNIAKMYGKLVENPGPQDYSPKIDSQTKRETIAPLLTILGRGPDHYLEEVEDMRQTRRGLNSIESSPEKKTAKKKDRFKIVRGDFAGVSIEDMRKALLPGPGTYDCNFEVATKFHRPPKACMQPRTNAAIPRKIILHESLDILAPGQKQTAVHYNIGKDPRQLHRSVSISEVLPQRKRETNGTGPGYYNLGHVGAVNMPEVVSNQSRLLFKPSPSMADFRKSFAKSTCGHRHSDMTKNC